MKSDFFVDGRLDKNRVRQALLNFRNLNDAIDTLSSSELYGAYRAELVGGRRTSVLSRIEKRLRQVTAERVSKHLRTLQVKYTPAEGNENE